jgi:hypothetical protein
MVRMPDVDLIREWPQYLHVMVVINGIGQYIEQAATFSEK